MICHVTVTTANMQETIDFYQWLLDLPIDRRFPIGNDGGEIVFFGKPEETKFEVIYQPGNKVIPAEGVTIGFAVTSLKEKIDMLDIRNIPHSPVIAPNPHASFCMFTDLNGVKIQLFEEHK